MKRTAAAWGLVVVWATCLFFLSEVWALPPGLAPLLMVPDKLAHFALYLVFGWLIARTRSLGGADVPHGILIAAGALYAAFDEWHQSVVPGRTPQLADWWADVAGLAVGYVAVAFAGRRSSLALNDVDQR